MGRMRLLLKLATVAGPAVYNVIRNYGPQLKRMMDENPELFEKVKDRLTAIVSAGKAKTGTKAISHRVEVLRDQVTYLYASANSVAMAEQASQWRAELDSIEKVIPVLDAMSTKARRDKKRGLEKQLDELSAKILAATLEDDVEDAEVVDGEEK